jgi:hypothetical protein
MVILQLKNTSKHIWVASLQGSDIRTHIQKSYKILILRRDSVLKSPFVELHKKTSYHFNHGKPFICN